MGDACREAARTRDDLADIINIALEDLVRQRYELPAFNTVLRTARAARTEINQGYYAQVRERLPDAVPRAAAEGVIGVARAAGIRPVRQQPPAGVEPIRVRPPARVAVGHPLTHQDDRLRRQVIAGYGHLLFRLPRHRR